MPVLLLIPQGNTDLGPFGATLVILLVGGLGAMFARSGYRNWRGSRRIHGGAQADAVIDRLYRTGNQFWGGGYWADVSFSDAAGIHHTTTIGVMPKLWGTLREGGRCHIVYSPSDPKVARFGGLTAQAVYAVSGLGVLIAGSALCLLMIALLIALIVQWTSEDPHRGMLESQPSTLPITPQRTPAELPKSK